MKRKISQEVFDKLSDAIKALYKKVGDAFVLELEDDEGDPEALKRAKDHEVQARKDAEKKAKELQAKLDALDEDGAKKRGDVEALTKSYEEKLAKAMQEAQAKIEAAQKHIRDTMLNATASEIAGKISTTPAIMSRFIRDRLEVDFSGEAPVLRILGADGKLSALTTEDLAKEFTSNKEFASIIKTSQASGSSASRTSNQGRALNKDGESVSFAKLSPKELASHIQASKENSNGTV